MRTIILSPARRILRILELELENLVKLNKFTTKMKISLNNPITIPIQNIQSHMNFYQNLSILEWRLNYTNLMMILKNQKLLKLSKVSNLLHGKDIKIEIRIT